MKRFEASELKKLYQPDINSNGEDNGQVTIIGGSSLFFGAPLLSLKVASRIVDMVFFASPEPSVGEVAENMKSKLLSYIWIPWEDLKSYIAKSDAVLIGPGMMRYSKQDGDSQYQKTRSITHDLLTQFPDKKWVIDAGSLQTMDPDWIPANAILTPNKKEFELLFGEIGGEKAAKKYNCTIVLKGPVTLVYSPDEVYEIHGGNPGLTKGGTGDVQAGLTVALLAKNQALLAACTASQLVKDTADALRKKQGIYYSADDLASEIPIHLSNNFRK